LLRLDDCSDRPDSDHLSRSIAHRLSHLDGYGDFHEHAHTHNPTNQNLVASYTILHRDNYPHRIHDLDSFTLTIANPNPPTSTDRYTAADVHLAASAV
jgi:hypothetical protein